MKIRAIRLENVRRFVDPVEIADIGDGLNVLTAPNERGKSTFFDALHAVFFKDRRSWDKEIRALVPYPGGDPEVTVDIELAEGVFRISKRWNSRRGGDARITSAGQLIKQADDAEAWIADTLKSPKDGGPAGLLWVRQGQSGLREGDNTHRVRRGPYDVGRRRSRGDNRRTANGHGTRNVPESAGPLPNGKASRENQWPAKASGG